MTVQVETGSRDHPEANSNNSSLWIWLSVLAVGLAVAGNIIALTIPRIYADLTPAFLPQAIAQDIASLAIVSPVWLILAVLALRGSVRAYLLWLGVLTFTIYNYVIYTFSVPFGPLYLCWIVVLGLSLYGLIGGIAATDRRKIASAFKSPRLNTFVGWFLIIVAVLFGLLWLSEDVPALLSGAVPQSLIDLGIPTNPVHILDLSFFLPTTIIGGILLLKKKPLGYTLAPAFIVFLILTGIPILITPFVQSARGQTAGWAVVIPIGILTLIMLALLIWLVSTIRKDR